MSDTLNSPDGDRKLISLSPRRRGRTIAHMTSVKAGGQVRRNTHRQKAVSLLQSSHRLRKIKCRKLGKIVCRISGKINAVFSGKVLAVYTTLDCTHKFNNYKDSAEVIRDISDQLCLEKGYSVITEPEEKSKDYAEWSAERSGTSWKAKLKDTISEMLPKCSDFEDLLRQMQERGYEVKRGKNISLRAPGQKRFTRLKTLGKKYTEEAIRTALKEQGGLRRRPVIAGKTVMLRHGSVPDIGFLIDIEKKLSERKGKGYEQNDDEGGQAGT